jgi:hypothetical protein
VIVIDTKPRYIYQATIKSCITSLSLSNFYFLDPPHILAISSLGYSKRNEWIDDPFHPLKGLLRLG